MTEKDKLLRTILLSLISELDYVKRHKLYILLDKWEKAK